MTERDLVRIFGVSQQQTRTGLPLFVVTANKVARPELSVQLQTVNACAASLCQRALELGRSIVVEHERTRYGPTLTGAYFLRRD